MRPVADEFVQMKNKVGEKITPIYLYSIQFDEIANWWLRLAGFSRNIIFDGSEYKAFSITHDKIGENLSGRIDRVTLRLGNANREMQYYLDNYDAFKGCKVSIKLVWLENLDNPNCFDEYNFVVESGDSDDKEVTLALKSGIDVEVNKIPKGKFNRAYCRFKFKSAECGYSGSEISCNKSFQRCQELNNVRRYGAFPGTPMNRLLIR